MDKPENTERESQNFQPIDKGQADRAITLNFYSRMLWTLARNTLYKDVTLTEWQEKNAIEMLRKWYEPVRDENMSKVHQIYVERMALARKYVKKDPQKRFIQLPHLYFDINNPSGFTGTKAWWNKQQVRNEEVRLKLILAAQVRKFMNNERKKSGDKRPSLDVFRECEQRLGKLNKPEILKEFYASIVRPEVFSSLYRQNQA